MPSAYENAYNEFNGRFGLNFDLYTEYTGAMAIGAIDDFAFDSTREQTEQNAYVDTLSAALSVYLNQKMQKIELGNERSYDLSDLSLGEFIDGFDKVIKGIRTDDAEKENQTYEHTPYAGQTLEQVARVARSRVNGINKPLSNVWAKQIRKGKLAPEQLRTVTDASISALNGVNSENYTKDNEKDLSNVLLAKEAMEKAIKSRSVFSYLNPANWGPYYRETQYKNALNNQIREFSQRNLPIAAVTASINHNILDNAFHALDSYVATHNVPAPKKAGGVREPLQNVNLEKAPKKDAVKKLDPKTEKKKLDNEKKAEEAKLKAIRSRKSEGKIKSADEANQLMRGSDVAEDVKGEIETYLEKSNAFMKRIVFSALNTNLQTAVSNGWRDFSNASNSEQKFAAMQNFAFKVFEEAFYCMAYDIDDLSMPEKLAAAQKIANLTLESYTPADKDSKYAEFSDNYFMKNAPTERFKTLAGKVDFQGNLDDLIRDTKVELGLEKAAMPLPGLSENSGSASKSPKVEETKPVSKEKSID